MTRNVGITLTDLAYEVWREIPHGLRSKVVCDFLTKNAETLINLQNPDREEKNPERMIIKNLTLGETRPKGTKPIH